MGKKRNDDEPRRERAYTGPTCQVRNGNATCILPAYRNIGGVPMCDQHAQAEERRQEEVREVQAEARAWCLARGLDTPAKVRAEAKRLARIVLTGAASKDWAVRIQERDAEGEQIPGYVTNAAYEVLR